MHVFLVVNVAQLQNPSGDILHYGYFSIDCKYFCFMYLINLTFFY